ncbi:MAG: CTP synthase (glutamine hydrolyzing) [Candidatus Micrarchaeota archaeon]|nr:CTP synthase (glutamine hydrolyzing) [Candidatus Micrarchaeota archaeon]
MQGRAKFIFVTGGVMSGLGKGIVSSSIAKLMQLSGKKVSCVKIDPYLNYDAGTMNPVAHGEVFVTEDGGECDMDIGNYERFLNQNMLKTHNITTAQVYSKVIEAERRGEYLGACVQIIPHVTNEIKDAIKRIAASEALEIVVVEVGGTVGDIESLPFLEALRQMRLEEGSDSVMFVHVTLAPSLEVVGEQKTKPTQHSVQELRRIGIQPDMLAVRCKKELEPDVRKKISSFSNVELKDVISCHDAASVLEVPRMLHSQGVVEEIFRKLGMPAQLSRSEEWSEWDRIVESTKSAGGHVRIAMVGKYVKLADSYVSVNHALRHAGSKIGRLVDIDWIDSEELNGNLERLASYDGIIVPGGFGERGAEGIINTANFARERNIPYLGICFGFQLAAVAFARGACGLQDANTTEINPQTKNPVIDLLPEQKGVSNKGATLRLGAHEIEVSQGSLAGGIYRSDRISKRHRHRYELNQKYIGEFSDKGMVFTGFSDGRRRAEILEIPGHRFYVAVQYHPEFNSRPGHPEEVFEAFVKASVQK